MLVNLLSYFFSSDLIENPDDFRFISENQDDTSYVTRTKAAFSRVWLKSLYYSAQAFLFFLNAPAARESIFKGSIKVISTHNFAKKRELPKYASTTSPISDSEMKKIALIGQKFGLSAAGKAFKVTPFGLGKCFGCVALFSRKAFEVGPTEALKDFEGGMPFSASFLQAVYTHFGQTLIHPGALKCIQEMIKKFYKEKKESALLGLQEIWKKEVGERLDIFVAVKEYLIKGNRIEDGGFVEFLKNELAKENASLGLYLGTIREIASAYEKKNLLSLDINRFGFFLAGLSMNVIHHDTSPETIFYSLDHLQDGKYALSISIFTPFGTYLSNHITCFVLQDKGPCVILEPNLAGAELTKKGLLRALRQMLSFYTGKNFSKPETGMLAFIKFFNNWMARKPNYPIFKKVEAGFSLYSLNPLEN